MPDSSTNRERVLQRAGDFATRNVAGETILVPIRSGVADLECVFTLDEVGTAVWKSLESPKTVDQVAAEIAGEFDVDPAEARRDVEEFVEALASSRLVRDAGDASHVSPPEASR